MDFNEKDAEQMRFTPTSQGLQRHELVPLKAKHPHTGEVCSVPTLPFVWLCDRNGNEKPVVVMSYRPGPARMNERDIAIREAYHRFLKAGWMRMDECPIAHGNPTVWVKPGTQPCASMPCKHYTAHRDERRRGNAEASLAFEKQAASLPAKLIAEADKRQEVLIEKLAEALRDR